jgi:plasmid stabilization system protein ParE
VKLFLFHPLAREEAGHAARHYAEISAALGGRFYDGLDVLIREICTCPEQYRMFDPPARRHFRRPFPCAVIFIDQPEHVWIVAVMHFKQHPGYWRERI